MTLKKSTIKTLLETYESNKDEMKEIENTDNYDSDSGYSDFIAENNFIKFLFRLEGLKLTLVNRQVIKKR